MEFRCIDECSQCCIEREYYPSKEFGKIGVLILPEEKLRIEKIAELIILKLIFCHVLGFQMIEIQILQKF